MGFVYLYFCILRKVRYAKGTLEVLAFAPLRPKRGADTTLDRQGSSRERRGCEVGAN